MESSNSKQSDAVTPVVAVPDRTEEEQARIGKAIAELLEMRERHPPLGDLKIKDLINEGRRY